MSDQDSEISQAAESNTSASFSTNGTDPGGYGGDGTGALMSMLQSCSPGLAVVNIDNGIGAGSMAALIANQAVRANR